MATKNNTGQYRNAFEVEQKRIDTVRKTVLSNNDKKAVTQIVQVQKTLNDEILTSAKNIESLTRQLQKANDQDKKILEKLVKQTEQQKRAKEFALEQLTILKEELNLKEKVFIAEEKRIKSKERQKSLEEAALEYAKNQERYTLQSYRNTEKQLVEKEKELKLLEDEYKSLSQGAKRSAYGQALKAQKLLAKQSLAELKEELKDTKQGLTPEDRTQAEKNSVSDLIYEVKQGFKKSFSSIDSLENSIVNAISESRNFFNGMVNGAVNTVSQYYGPIAASLEGVSGDINDFKSLNSKLQLDVGLSSLVQQEKVLGNINDLVTQGITSDIESLGILKTIKDKTITSFDVTNADLRRLVKLNQQKGNLTAKQFGLADALKESFNSTFGDSSYINDMFQSVTGTVLDAVSANANTNGTDSTSFYSVLSTWLGAMYESGMSRNTVDSIARGINLLGSGNINELSSNKSLQNLMLLSMDRAGLDYADILQRGLSDSDINILLSNMVDYLAEITDNTKQNNVLQSSYAGLFNMSISDMTALQNLSKSNFKAKTLNGEGALSQALSEINKLSYRTSVAEQINNVVDNAKYAFGSSIASNKLAYITYKTSNLILDSLDGITNTVMGSGNSGGTKQKLLGKLVSIPTDGVRLATSVAYLGSLLPGLLGFSKSLGGSLNNLFSSGNNNSLASVIAQTASGGIYDNGISSNGTIVITTNNNTLKKFSFDDSVKASGITDTSSWENDATSAANEEDANTKILKNFEKTLMKSREGDGYAFAVSLQGMSDGVLRSFASIFADEDAMMDTLTGKNNALEKNNTFIDYVEDTSTIKR